jgi:hypothetical protein
MLKFFARPTGYSRRIFGGTEVTALLAPMSLLYAIFDKSDDFAVFRTFHAFAHCAYPGVGATPSA